MTIYIVTRRSENKSDVPNLGVHLSLESAENHFNGIVEDRKGNKHNYKCKVHWVQYMTNRKDDVRGTYKEAYIEHPKTKYQDKYVEMLQIEYYIIDNKEVFIELL